MLLSESYIKRLGELAGLKPSKSASILKEVEDLYSNNDIERIDGITINGKGFWFNVRKSNTEPLIRVVIEAGTEENLYRVREKLLSELR